MSRECISPAKEPRIELKGTDGACDIEDNPGEDAEGQKLHRYECSETVHDQKVDVHVKPNDHPAKNELISVHIP